MTTLMRKHVKQLDRKLYKHVAGLPTVRRGISSIVVAHIYKVFGTRTLKFNGQMREE